ncbi:MAG: GrpB family protein [Opitutaceae bacterium]|nr:GrpB family protein [Opitutaceae bacterium]
MPKIILQEVSAMAPLVERLLARLRPQLRHLLPTAEIEHIGATAIPGAITKGDVDVMVRVTPAEFRAAADVLSAHFAIKQPENWTPDFASFGDDDSYDLPLGVQLVAKNTDADQFSFLRDHFITNPAALADYNRLKQRHAGDGAEAYWKAKNALFESILSTRER